MDPNDRRSGVAESDRAEQRFVACPGCGHENPGVNAYCTACDWPAGVRATDPEFPRTAGRSITSLQLKRGARAWQND